MPPVWGIGLSIGQLCSVRLGNLCPASAQYACKGHEEGAFIKSCRSQPQTAISQSCHTLVTCHLCESSSFEPFEESVNACNARCRHSHHASPISPTPPHMLPLTPQD